MILLKPEIHTRKETETGEKCKIKHSNYVSKQSHIHDRINKTLMLAIACSKYRYEKDFSTHYFFPRIIRLFMIRKISRKLRTVLYSYMNLYR